MTSHTQSVTDTRETDGPAYLLSTENEQAKEPRYVRNYLKYVTISKLEFIAKNLPSSYPN